MPAARGATVALDGFGAEQGFEALAEGARAAAADGIRLRVFGPPQRARPRRRRRHRGRPRRGVDRQRGRPGARGPREARGLGRPRRRRRRRGPRRRARQPRLDRGDDGGRDLRPAPPAAACSARRSRSSCRFRAARSSSSTSAPTSRSAPSTWSSSPSSAPPSARRCSASSGPRVGLLSVGEEAGKGREEVVAAHAILSQAPGIEFVGNVEGGDLPAATADVVVTDGFTGNVALKLMEGTARDRHRRDPRRRPLQPDGLRRRPADAAGARRPAPRAHPDTTGGAILLGLRGIAVVGHGSAGAEGIANSVRLAARAVEVDAVGRTAALLREGGAGRARPGLRGRRRGRRVIGSGR